MRNVVASGHPAVTAAATEVLGAGGNAFDAAVAAGFAAAVAEPTLTGLGGGGFLLARTAAGETTLFDFFVDVPGRDGDGTHGAEPIPVTVHFPGSDQVFHAGPATVAVPGNVGGYLHVHDRLGRLPLATVVEPAVRLARAGVVLNHHQAYVVHLLEPILTLDARGRELFAPTGRTLGTGDRFANPDLAGFLAELPRGSARELYAGALAEAIAREMAAAGGRLTRADLAAFRVRERRPLRTRCRDLEVLTNPAPSLGGPLLDLALRLYSDAGPPAGEHGSPAHLARLVAVLVEVERLRAHGVRQGGSVAAPAAADSLARIRASSGGTTHVSVADRDGNVASMTTSNGEGSGYVVPGTGIMLNNMLGEDDLHAADGRDAPGERVASMMAPTLLLDRRRVRLALGSAGSKRIRTALFEVLTACVDFGLPLRAAVDAPRLHWDGERVQVEPGFAEPALAELERRWPVNRWQVLDVYFGGVQAVDPSGDAAADPRRGGTAQVQ